MAPTMITRACTGRCPKEDDSRRGGLVLTSASTSPNMNTRCADDLWGMFKRRHGVTDFKGKLIMGDKVREVEILLAQDNPTDT